jgi:hypothetical protein
VCPKGLNPTRAIGKIRTMLLQQGLADLDLTSVPLSRVTSMQQGVMQRMWQTAHLSGGNAAYVEELYELYLHDPNAVPEEWRTYFHKPAGR